MMNSVAPVWDGNETWLVLGGGGLFAVFPLAYSIIMPALYVPIYVMLLALVFRGVAFEFRFKTKRAQFLWDWAFGGGSIVAAFAQGIALGALVQGIPVAGRAYAGGWWDWLTPFSLITGVALVIGYGLLGAGWLIWKTEKHVQALGYRAASILAPATLVLIAIVSAWTPFLNAVYMKRWFWLATNLARLSHPRCGWHARLSCFCAGLPASRRPCRFWRRSSFSFSASPVSASVSIRISCPIA